MKKIGVVLSLLSIIFFSVCQPIKAEENTKERNDYTIGEIQEILLNYLSEKGLEYEVGSEEFTNFVNDQVLNDTDKELTSRSDYELITAYMVEYLYELERLEVEKAGGQSNSVEYTEDALDESEVQDELSLIEDKTLGDIKEEVESEEENVFDQEVAFNKQGYDGSLSNVQPKTMSFLSYNGHNKAYNVEYLSSGYSVAKAKKYVDKWYNSRNPYYDRFSSDCTNFVSQILVAGGKSMKYPSYVPNGVNKNNNYWYMKTQSMVGVYVYNRSLSWAAVPEFYTYWSKRQSTKTSKSKQTIISAAKAGDVVQFKKKGADRYSHTMFVYEKSNNTLYLSGHTDNYKKKNFKNISSNWIEFRVIKF